MSAMKQIRRKIQYISAMKQNKYYECNKANTKKDTIHKCNDAKYIL